MRHFLNFEEFKDFILKERPSPTEFGLDCEDVEGNTTYILFRKQSFFGTIILYTAVFMEGVGMLQDDARGWYDNILNLWETITDTYEMAPYFVEEAHGKNLF